MKLLAISGSARRQSTNTALLNTMSDIAPIGIKVLVFHQLLTLPVFSPDLEGKRTPSEVLTFLNRVSDADGIIISSPEYVRAMPGGLKNAIDWMVSREEIIRKPISLAHASHRGDDMLASLRLVLGTVSESFEERLFIRIPLMAKSPEDISALLRLPEHAAQIAKFLSEFAAAIRERSQGRFRAEVGNARI